MNIDRGILPDEIKEECLCPGCPSHNEYMKSDDERLFCSGEKSGWECEKRGCLCGTCPLRGEHDLDDFYYCGAGTNSK